MMAIEYGSRHNGIASRYSDRDLLLIHHGWNDAKEEKRKFQLLGYDVTMMNEKKAIHLSKSGSLFLKHVINEGKVISGDNNIHGRLWSLWSPKDNYQDEIDSNVDILELMCFLPRNNFSMLFMNDLLITSIRNISIRIFASRGIYVFAWEEIFKKLHEHGFISENNINALLLSRKIKNAYRLRMFYKLEFSFVCCLIDIAKKIIKFHCRLTFCNRKSVILSLPDKFPERSYKQLRAYEIICSYYSFRSEVNNIADMVSNPCYFSHSKVGSDFG